MKAKKIVTLLVAAALTCGVVGSTTSVYAADVTLKLAHADAEGTIFDQGAVAFQEKLQELSGGTMDVELYRNGTLGSLSEVAEGIQMGTVDVAPIVTTTLANFASELNAFDMPYLIDDYDMVLLAPQVAYLLPQLKNKYGNKIFIIDSLDFATNDFNAIIKKAVN